MIVYSFLHELGHVLIGIIRGGKIAAFKIGIGAYVSIIGANYNSISLPLSNAFGVILPYLINVLIIPLYKNSMNIFIKIFIFFFTIAVSASLLPWIFIPFLYIKGKAPAGDDVTKFLDNSNISPWLLSSIALLLMFLLLFLCFKIKKIHISYISIIKELKKSENSHGN